ncbi:hypothetical protein [uncultured Ferrimonas sp.]|uniref:hypothetical protein n=1 Tax=uncultured Ferrimonas sp. TaxID=432640 RepID=UPI00262948BE|nr:hypothetical protein [uncultured Ferrimonas sp.]
MSLTIFFILLGALLLVVVGINMLQQHKQQLERARRQEMAKQKAIMDEVEQLLACGPLLPFTNVLVRLLNQRLLEAVRQVLAVDTRNRDMLARQSDLQAALANLKKNPPTERTVDSFNTPQAEKQIMMLIKVLKRLKEFVRQEQKKGTLTHDEFVTESRRADQVMLRINGSVLMDRARHAALNHQVGSARQHLNQLAKVLNSHTGDDQYKKTAMVKVSEMLEELNQRQQANLQEHVDDQVSQDTDELDELFSPKKKW